MRVKLHDMQQVVKPHFHVAASLTSGEHVKIHHMKLAEIRRSRGLTQDDLAEMIGKSKSTLSRAENGAPSAMLETYIDCADALGVTLSDIFADEMHPAEAMLIDTFRRLDEQGRNRLMTLLDLAKDLASQEVPKK